MAENPFQQSLASLLEKAEPGIVERRGLQFKKSFGAIAAYVDGHIFAACGNFGVALKLPPATLADLFRQDDVKPFKYFPNGRVKKQYAVIPERLLNDADGWAELLKVSLRYVTSGEVS